MRILTSGSVPHSDKHLIALMQRINFGSIEGLIVRNGEPVLDPSPRVVREIKFGGENGPRPEAARNDFALKAQIVELLSQMEAMGNGVIHRLEVKNGLPFMMTIEEDAA